MEKESRGYKPTEPNYLSSKEAINGLGGLRAFWEIVPAISCNFRCLNCYAADNARPDKGLLDWDRMRVALDRAIYLGVTHINVLGGEPFTYKYLEKFVEYFKSRVTGGFCGVVSNGSLVTEARAGSLLNSGLDQLSVSLDGTEAEINDANRGRGTFKKALIGIENIINVGLPLTIAYTVTPFNTKDTPKLFSFVQNLGAQALAVQITEMLGRAKRTLSGINTFSRFEALKAICRIYHTVPPVYTEVSTRSLFKAFLNHFFNAGLTLPEVRCDGGLKTFMVSSSGDLYPCSEYAYFSDGRQKNKGVNLASDDLEVIREFVEGKYVSFNTAMRSLETKKFTTCQDCEYSSSCAPCPLANPSGTVPECEWVKSQTRELNGKILHSKVKLKIEPSIVNGSEIRFLVPTQKEPLVIPMGREVFKKLMMLGSVSQIVEMFKNDATDNDVESKVIEFLCKLRSHQIIEIEGFDAFLN